MNLLILDTTTKSIKARLGSAISTYQPIFIVAYADNDGSVFTEGAADGLLNSTTEVELVSAPAADTRRIIKSISIYNKDDADVVLTFIYDNNGTKREFGVITLESGETWNSSKLSLVIPQSTSNPDQVSALEITAGSETALRSFSPADIAAFFAKHSIVLIPFSISDTSSDLEAGTAKGHFHMPFTGTLLGIYAGVQTAPAGSTLIFDVNKAGSTVLSTKISIDSAEKSSHTAETAPVISNTSFTKGDEVTADIDQVGSTTPGKWATIYMMFKVTAL